MKYVLHRDDHGFADTINDESGNVVRHLNPGTKRNEENAESFIDELARLRAENERLRAENKRLREKLDALRRAEEEDYLRYDAIRNVCDCMMVDGPHVHLDEPEYPSAGEHE